MNSIDIYNAHLKMKMRHAIRDLNGNVSYKRNGEHSRDEVLAIRLKFPNKIPPSARATISNSSQLLTYAPEGWLASVKAKLGCFQCGKIPVEAITYNEDYTKVLIKNEDYILDGFGRRFKSLLRCHWGIIVERYYKETDLPHLDKRKFLVPQELTMSQFVCILRNRMKISQSKALFLLVNNRSMISLSRTIAEVYSEYLSDDGFLYITYTSQEVFGMDS